MIYDIEFPEQAPIAHDAQAGGFAWREDHMQNVERLECINRFECPEDTDPDDANAD